MKHLLVRRRDILGFRRFDSHVPLLPEDAVESGDRAGVTALHEFDPEDDKTGARVPAAHIRNGFQLLRGVLIGMGMRSSGAGA